MGAVILSIGSELLRGDIVDTNAAFLARELTALGIPVSRVEQMGDTLAPLTDTVRRALETAGVTVCTGGLGPTADDLTRQAIADALDEEIFLDETLIAAIEERFQGLHRAMPRSNLRQASLIPSAEAIPNPNGTAPGWYVQRDGKVIVALPGPPSEMKPMWRDSIMPRFQEERHEELAMVALMTFGIGESSLERQIAEVIAWRPDVIVATYAKENGVQVHVTARAASAGEARALLDEVEAKLRAILGSAIFGTGDTTLAQVVGTALQARGLTLATMESCTAGELSDLITDVPGATNYFPGGIVAYTGKTKARYGVDRETMDTFGLISGQTALAMARAARQNLDTDIGVGVTGIAGTEPLEGKLAGTCFVAVSGPFGEETREIHRAGPRQTVKRFFSQCALDLLRRALAGSVSEQ